MYFHCCAMSRKSAVVKRIRNTEASKSLPYFPKPQNQYSLNASTPNIRTYRAWRSQMLIAALAYSE